MRCFIGLGSNLDNPIEQVKRALDELAQLPDTQLIQHSALYRSEPVGPAGQPDYINAVAELNTELDAECLLDHLQALEQAHQRVRLEHWGPRTLDLDLLLYGQETIATARLSVPHPWMTQRSFVLYPLAEIAPDLQLPDGSLLSFHLADCPMGSPDRLAL
ncbi:2-amino-4-hydroxy-6-hydroxymethyldihydropteridine diphosphokinase [Nitrincola tapanii]|uniref:2-amino-4-hydroxy-6-hydroxymethyldihydropteridine pyrophosphokinase n=1 Tax=Nitrincola tapanii TaxID=1708751 RepID=A0A5A9W0L0_9GAMM|nr:2-amino-4-hydroxy-6-hydroxymethyldihydropteridine diphosphokinase [Nitrincola tapanii]KAA0873665.1 2-amino-4-hydroxy-6-hydroxymethyldihydropteridine diphosphokinase [Nitrincola tapanii]